MGIDLALSRISKLLQLLGNPHNAYKSIHVAGTNGKGSTVAYISSILTQAQITNGRFTSPHLLYYNDCITINNMTYPVGEFNRVSELVKQKNKTHDVGCTEFELLTATAFKIFELERVEFAVIEVGLGGRLDATNVLQPYGGGGGGVVACGVTKIAMDHESFLGSTLREIATEKAGIIKDGIPCVLDRSNNEEAIAAITETARECNSDLYMVDGNTESTTSSSYRSTRPESLSTSLITFNQVQALVEKSPLKGAYQLQNLSVSIKLIELLIMTGLIPKLSHLTFEQGISKVKWPGRLQSIQYKTLPLLIDGAHNESAAKELGKYLDIYRKGEGIIFIIGLSRGKNITDLLKHITNKSSDSLIATTFTPPQGMPWVSSYAVEDVQKAAKTYVEDIIPSTNDDTIADILQKVEHIKSQGDTRNVVVCGSLYLCSDVLRLVHDVS